MPEIDLDEVQGLIRGVVQQRLGKGTPQEEVEDCVQDANARLIRFKRACELRREPIRDLNAVAATIADRAAKTLIRYWKTHPRPEPIPEGFDPPDTRALPRGVKMRAFLVIQFFRHRRSECLELAEAHFVRGLTWKEVARERNAKPNVVRKQWSRCAQTCREALGHDNGPWRELLE